MKMPKKDITHCSVQQKFESIANMAHYKMNFLL